VDGDEEDVAVIVSVWVAVAVAVKELVDVTDGDKGTGKTTIL